MGLYWNRLFKQKTAYALTVRLVGSEMCIRDRIKRGEDVIGSVGVSGDLPDRDEICAIAGVEAAGLTYQI